MKKLLLILFTSTLILAATPKFLMPDEAFISDAKVNSQMQIEVTLKIAKDIYVYEEQTKFSLKEGSGISIAKKDGPKSVEHHDEMVYLESPSFVVTLQKESGVTGIKNIELSFSYQGCSEQGLCYEPLTTVYNFDIDTSKLDEASIKKPELKSLNVKKIETKKEEKVEPVKEELSESDAIADTIKSGNIFVILLTFLGFGLLLALTPCVFPMIPIISGVIISQGDGITTKKAFMLSMVYVLAMAVAYTVAGVLAGLFGSNLQAALQTPWVIYSFSGVFVALALSMFGFYELKLPDSLVSKVSSSKHKSGFIGVAIMGFLSALIVGPCVAAPLAGALVYIGQTGDAVLGGMALFSMSIGMGIPLIIVGVSAGKFMPKPGAWMTMVSAIFGVMMLGVAVWMLERVADVYVTMILYSMLGIGFAIYLGTFDKDSHIFKRSVAVIMFIYSVALFIGVLGGSTSMIKPLSFLKPQVVSTVTKIERKHTEFVKVTSIAELDELLSKHKGKKIMLDFYADWCTSCKELEEVTFANESVKNKMDEFILIQADVTDNKKEQKDLSKKYGVFGPPAILFFDKDSKVIKSKTIIGFIEPDEFLTHLNKI
ncbi:Thiol:disulfide interchange protein dsbD precursor [Sulfurimonas gotlandica GD1]|uniref:Thiol:disulfide interchange protein dsbD n=1 Tax=Sulfurimonas gotlandica (strain DSM 19862 / JCM 16533 / GD1) TaxID=929558 RepID=B6BLC4_SULGG|nr:protein-disulfide reductase DsbD [Sulfurimonas gotlandica]EDZ62009.1 thiol:disulfide interchange protein DsbD [Sulfurimonas gotlandica GD1]EHP28578.1 Thiol:disulfide interchange protein dsbD precursor [Sulfurimonas gotlandica GD1]